MKRQRRERKETIKRQKGDRKETKWRQKEKGKKTQRDAEIEGERDIGRGHEGSTGRRKRDWRRRQEEEAEKRGKEGKRDRTRGEIKEIKRQKRDRRRKEQEVVCLVFLLCPSVSVCLVKPFHLSLCFAAAPLLSAVANSRKQKRGLELLANAPTS